MSARSLPQSQQLQPAALDLLTAVWEHLNIPPYAEGDKAARRAWRDLLEIRVADVVGTLGGLLAVSAEAATDAADCLRSYRPDPRPNYATSEVDQ